MSMLTLDINYLKVHSLIKHNMQFKSCFSLCSAIWSLHCFTLSFLLFTRFNTSHFDWHLLNLWRSNCFALLNIALSNYILYITFFITLVSFTHVFCTFLYYWLYIWILQKTFNFISKQNLIRLIQLQWDWNH